MTEYRCRPNVPGNMTRPAPPPVATPLPSRKPPRKELMDMINQYSFAVNEANLFLDTHPYDMEALAYFQKYRKLRMEAVEEYSKYYAPLVIDHTIDEQTPWSWAMEPWPWEGVDC